MPEDFSKTFTFPEHNDKHIWSQEGYIFLRKKHNITHLQNFLYSLGGAPRHLVDD